MRFVSIASGSSGNCIYTGTEESHPQISGIITEILKEAGQKVEAVMMAKAGLIDDDKPMASLLFVGPKAAKTGM